MSKKPTISFQYIDFDKLVFLENNPRTRTPKGLETMAADIESDPTFYENRPTLVNFTDGEYRVYAGDLRAHAAHDKLGWKQVPCNVEADVPQKVMERRAILDNTHREGWDSDALENWGFEVEELEEMGVPDWVFGGDVSDTEGERESDKSKFDQSADSYLNNSIRQVVLYYDIETHERVLQRMQAVGNAYEIEDDNSAVVLKLLEFYESKK